MGTFYNPLLKVRNEKRVINLLHNISKLELSTNWNEIVDYQYKCLSNGLNGIGIFDLLIAQNAKQNDCKIYTLDRHFELMKKILSLQIQM